MIIRQTTQMRMVAGQDYISQASRRLAELTDQASSNRKLNRASDDPSSAASALIVRAAQKSSDQYSRNIQDGIGWASTLDSTLASVNTALGRARDLIIQGANDGSMSAQAKESIASELESIRASLLATSNTEYLGRSVFAGNSDAGIAFADDYSFTGGAGSVERRIGDGKTVRVDVDGSTVFGVGATSIFATLDQIATDLRNGTNVSAWITDIDATLDGVRDAQSRVGVSHATLLAAHETNLTQQVELESQRSSLEDLDLSTALIELKAQETTYQAALAVTARAGQYNLMDFLK